MGNIKDVTKNKGVPYFRRLQFVFCLYAVRIGWAGHAARMTKTKFMRYIFYSDYLRNTCTGVRANYSIDLAYYNRRSEVLKRFFKMLLNTIAQSRLA